MFLSRIRKKHDDAHINWEWWTAVNGAYFHNPDQASDSLNRSMTISQEGIKLLDDAMARRRDALRAAAASVPALAAPPAIPVTAQTAQTAGAK